MPAFEPPTGAYKNETWVREAKFGFRNPNRLWGDYWRRFNTITIPLMDEDAYFADALDAARRADNREHLEELLSNKYDERRRDLEDLLRKIALDSVFPRWGQAPTNVARYAALKAGQTGSLASFLQVVCGVVYGWEDGEDDDARSSRGVSTEEAATGTNSAGDQGVDSCDVGGDDTGDDAYDAGGDPYEYENRQVHSLGLWEGWQTAEEDPYYNRPWRVAECGDADKESKGRQLLPAEPPPADEQDAIPAMGAILSEHDNALAGGPPYTAHNADHSSSAEASPEAAATTHTPMPSPPEPTDDSPAGLASRNSSPIPSPESSPPGPAPHAPKRHRNSPLVYSTTREPSSQGRVSGPAIIRGSRKRRAYSICSADDRDDDDGEQQRQKRRIADGDGNVGSSPHPPPRYR